MHPSSVARQPANPGKSPLPPFAAGVLGIVFKAVAWLAREMAMSELRQQMLALWILLMLLLMVPWVLE
jgi:hypothetical protein